MNDLPSPADREPRAPLLGPAVAGRARGAGEAPEAPAAPALPPAPFVSSRHRDPAGAPPAAEPEEAPAPAPAELPRPAEAAPQTPPRHEPPREDWFDRFDLSAYGGGVPEVVLDEAPAAPLVPELSQAETLTVADPLPGVERTPEPVPLETAEPADARAQSRAVVLGRLAERLEEIARTLRRGSVPDPSGDPLEAWLAGYALGFLDASRADEPER